MSSKPVTSIIRRSTRKVGAKLNILATLIPEMVEYNLNIASTGHNFFFPPEKFNGQNIESHAIHSIRRSGKDVPTNFVQLPTRPQYDSHPTNPLWSDSSRIWPAYLEIDTILCSNILNQQLCSTLGHVEHIQTVSLRLPLDPNWINANQKKWQNIVSYPPKNVVYVNERAREDWLGLPYIESHESVIISENCENFSEEMSKILMRAAEAVYTRSPNFRYFENLSASNKG